MTAEFNRQDTDGAESRWEKLKRPLVDSAKKNIGKGKENESK